MANNQIVISRIQNRRGRRENLPQPLLPGEIALTADTDQAWMGNDPELAVPAVRVYKDKNIANAQTILDTSIVEAKFDGTFTAADFGTSDPDITMVDNVQAGCSGTCTYDDTGLNSGKYYYYRVAAVNTNGTGPLNITELRIQAL